MTLEEQVQKLTAERAAALKALKKYDDELAGAASGATFDFIKRLTAEKDAVLKSLRESEELSRMQLCAVMTASVQNTESTIKDRIDRSNPYWTQTYADVCAAVDREMRERADKDAALKACAEMRDVILKCLCRDGVPVIGDPEEAWINHAISSDCGKGYVKAESLRCFRCDDGHAPLYCLNCARDGYHADSEWAQVVEALKTIRDVACGETQCKTEAVHALAHAEKLTTK